MNKISNFDEFYDKKLSPYLSELKKQNNSAVNWSMVLVFGPFVLIPLFTISFSNVFESYLKLIVTAVVILIFVAIYKYTSINDSCEEKFKKQVAGKIISFIYPGLTYNRISLAIQLTINAAAYTGNIMLTTLATTCLKEPIKLLRLNVLRCIQQP